MRSKGFTLIELLAVIVILAIIALIATPIILGIINDVRVGARERSIDNIIQAAEMYYAQEKMKNVNISNKINIEAIKDKIDGEIPEGGYIILNEAGDAIFNLEFKDKTYVKLSTGEIIEEPKNADKYYIKVETTESIETEPFLYGPIRKEEIEKVTTVPTNKVPSDVIGYWDVTEQGNGKIMAWYYDKDSNGLYEVYIGQEGRVKANPDSGKLFNYLINVKEIDVTYFDTSNVTSMWCMFQRCENLEKIIGIENFDTSKVENMRNLFNKCYKLQSINLSSFDTTQTTNLSGMFQCCSSLVSLDVSGFNTSKVIDMKFMFAGTKVDNISYYMKLEKIIGLENFKTSQVTDMSSMFQLCSSLTSLDLSNWDTGKVTDMSWMFYGTTNLKPIYIGEKWKTASETTNMFGGAALTVSVDEMCGPNSTESWCTVTR